MARKNAKHPEMQDELFDLALFLNSAKKPYFTASIFNKEWVDIKI